MSAAILCIGTELTRGELVNTNAAWLADALTTLGFEVTAVDCTDDDRSRIQEGLRRLGERHDVLVCTGGLGPTTDDLTTECVATLLGVSLERDLASLEKIRERMERFGRTLSASNAKQADLPRGARVLPNPRGTAPGFAVKLQRAHAFFLPGVPHEMEAMFDNHVAPSIQPLVSDHVRQIVLKTFGMTESAVNDGLAGLEAEHGVLLGYRARFPEIEVKVLARNRSARAAEAQARAAADSARARLGPDVVYGEGSVGFPESVGRLLVERRWTLGVAESCTGGLVSELLTERSGASEFFAGAVVSYSNEVKERVLGVPAAVLADHGSVSAQTARAMAEGARRVLAASVALSITGVAGPTGGTLEKPVGLVHFAVATGNGTSARQLSYPGSRQQIQRLSAFAGLALLRKVIQEGHNEQGS